MQESIAYVLMCIILGYKNYYCLYITLYEKTK